MTGQSSLPDGTTVSPETALTAPIQPDAPMTYKAAGVDIDAADSLIARIGPAAARTRRPGVMGGLGGFGGLFDLKATGLQDPVLVSGTDGVGTKLEIAITTGLHDGIGQDLVAMCVNDVLAQGAEPLFFLDYFACGKLDVDVAARVIEGIARGCEIAGCALIGGETAEMPGMYPLGTYDLAGFCVGAVERKAILPRLDQMGQGDVLIGIPSSGPHANGYSLIRAVVARSGLAWDATAPFSNDQTLAQALMVPTALYPRLIAPLLKSGWIKGLAHITGGGLTENVPRMLPDTVQARYDDSALGLTPVFDWLARAGRIETAEMRRTFNCGIGMVLAVAPDDVEAVLAAA
ncbi:MAG: phosphoribosylformylglycinamidine cyclo-ligase, partial [Hyphomonadaceae bacterium]|nr:phosphoribosylformylglycinamidine cyclo-ligase [Hyphomonadaceae bacterium]